MSGIDFNSFSYPYVPEFSRSEGEGENHTEPAGTQVSTSLADKEHPIFSTSNLKNLLNRNRRLGASDEPMLEGDVLPDVIMDLIDASSKTKFPFELLLFATDIVEKLDDRSGATDAIGIVQEHINYARELVGILGRQPLNSEVFMAGMLGDSSMVKTVIENAINAPHEIAQSLGSKFDDIIMNKMHLGNKMPRTNKQIYQYFKRRMQVGSNTFPHLPLGGAGTNAI